MKYIDFMVELEKEEESEVYTSLQTVREAIKRCPEEEKEWMKDWSANLDRLTTMTEGEYKEVKDDLFDGLTAMIDDYHAPGSLFRDVKVQSAMVKLFSALELDKKAFKVPGFTLVETKQKYARNQEELAMQRKTSDIQKAEEFSKNNPVDYVAQFMAYSNLRDTASPEMMFRAIGRVNKYKEARALQMAAQDAPTMSGLTKGNYDAFSTGYVAKQEEVDKESLSFKDCSKIIAEDYRKGSISYTQLEMRMQLLREMTEEDVQLRLRSDDIRYQFEGMKEPAIRNQIQESVKVYYPDFEKKVKDLEAKLEKEKQQSKTKEKLEAAPGVGDSVTTTAQDIYNDLTKQYKAGQIKYAAYEEQLKTMRELTGGNKNCRIDLDTINKAIEDRVEREAYAKRIELQENISKLTGHETEFKGPLGKRLRGMYDVYGMTPKKSYASIKSTGYTEEDFALLKDMKKDDAEQYMKLSASTAPLNNDDFAVLAIAVTQSIPEIGGKHFRSTYQEDTGKHISVNIVKDPNLDDCIRCRGNYTTDAYQGEQGARTGFGSSYIPNVTVPAREKADELLQNYGAGKGSPEELGRVLGLGLKNMLDPIFLAASADTDFRGEMLMDGAVAGRLADIITRDPTIEAEARKYTNQEELDTARGFKYLFNIASSSRVAMQKLKKSAEKEQPLPEAERNACVELVLRNKALLSVAKRHAAEKEAGKELTELMTKSVNAPTEWMNMSADKRPSEAEQELFYMEQDLKQDRAYGYPEFVKAMGIAGPDYAKALLDKVMPNREALYAKSDKEIMSALGAHIGSRDDPFQNKEYTTDPAKKELGKSIQAPQKSVPQTGLSLN